MAKAGKNKADRSAGDGRLRTVYLAAFYLVLALGSTLWFPEEFYDGFETPKLFAVELASCLALAGWALHRLVVRRRPVELRLPVELLPLAGLFALAAVSIVWSGNRWLAAERLLHYSVLAWAAFFAWLLYRDRNVRPLLVFIAAVGSVLAGWGLLLDAVVPLREAVYPHFKEVWGGGRVVDNYRLLTSNQGNPNYLFHLLVLTVPLTLGAAIQSLALLRRKQGDPREFIRLTLLAAGFLLQLACYTYAANRSGLVATAGALVLFVLVLLVTRRSAVAVALARYWKHALLGLVLLVSICGAAARFTDAGGRAAGAAADVLSSGWENWQRRFSTLRSTENIDVYSRVVFLETGADMFSDDPLLGKGVGQFVIQYPRYKSATHWERFSLLPPEITKWTLIPEQAHNEYLQALIELGLPGLLLFLAFWVMLARRTWKCLETRKLESDYFLLLGAGTGLAGVLANSLLTFPFQTVTSGLMAWSAAGALLAVCCTSQSGARMAGLTVDPRRPAWTAALALLLAAGVAGAWGSLRIVRSEHSFFMAMKQHAHDLGYSLRQGERAAVAMPHRFEMQYVQGWLGRLANDTTAARVYFERSAAASPWFPPPYWFLAEYYFANGDRDRAELALKRYGELYPPGRDGQYHYRLGMILLRDPEEDRFDEARVHLRRAGRVDADLVLTEQFLARGMPDSARGTIAPHRERLRPQNEMYDRIYFLSAVSALAVADTTNAAALLDTLLNRTRNPEGSYAQEARNLQEQLGR